MKETAPSPSAGGQGMVKEMENGAGPVKIIGLPLHNIKDARYVIPMAELTDFDIVQ